jgi:hypothetical protein
LVESFDKNPKPNFDYVAFDEELVYATILIENNKIVGVLDIQTREETRKGAHKKRPSLRAPRFLELSREKGLSSTQFFCDDMTRLFSNWTPGSKSYPNLYRELAGHARGAGYDVLADKILSAANVVAQPLDDEWKKKILEITNKEKDSIRVALSVDDANGLPLVHDPDFIKFWSVFFRENRKDALVVGSGKNAKIVFGFCPCCGKEGQFVRKLPILKASKFLSGAKSTGTSIASFSDNSTWFHGFKKMQSSSICVTCSDKIKQSFYDLLSNKNRRVKLPNGDMMLIRCDDDVWGYFKSLDPAINLSRFLSIQSPNSTMDTIAPETCSVAMVSIGGASTRVCVSVDDVVVSDLVRSLRMIYNDLGENFLISELKKIPVMKYLMDELFVGIWDEEVDDSGKVERTYRKAKAKEDEGGKKTEPPLKAHIQQFLSFMLNSAPLDSQGNVKVLPIPRFLVDGLLKNRRRSCAVTRPSAMVAMRLVLSRLFVGKGFAMSNGVIVDDGCKAASDIGRLFFLLVNARRETDNVNKEKSKTQKVTATTDFEGTKIFSATTSPRRFFATNLSTLTYYISNGEYTNATEKRYLEIMSEFGNPSDFPVRFTPAQELSFHFGYASEKKSFIEVYYKNIEEYKKKKAAEDAAAGVAAIVENDDDIDDDIDDDEDDGEESE